MRGATIGAAAIIGLAVGLPAHGADASLFTSASLPGLEPSWAWVAGGAALGLVVGFALGWRTLSRRIRRKYGGLKIY